VLGPLRTRTARGTRALVSGYGEWVGVGGARRAPAFGPNAVDYLIGAGEDAYFRARQATDDRPVAAAVSTGLAALADERGELAVRIQAGILVVRVAATIDHFPSANETVVVVDRDALLSAVNALRPGTGQANEIWLDTPPGSDGRVAAALERPPFDVLAANSREELLAGLRSEPLARGTLIVLTAAMAVALVLGLVGVLLLALADARGQSRELFDLEVQGAAPPMLRRHVRLRLALVAAPGVLGGLVAGLALSAIVVDFVALTADEAAPKPPLALGLDWPVVVVTVGGFLAAVLALGAAHSSRAFRAPYPEDDAR
jgi:FtsX-like permease family